MSCHILHFDGMSKCIRNNFYATYHVLQVTMSLLNFYDV